jgi:hypothetical protein
MSTGLWKHSGAAGCATELTFPHWLGKAYCGEDFIDIIFSSGNGLARVDEGWFTHAVEDEVLGLPVNLIPPEEMLWSKAFVMERERYDGADINHLLRARAADLDWSRLLERFGEHWPVLLSHVVLFAYVYPAEASNVPTWVIHEAPRQSAISVHRPSRRRPNDQGSADIPRSVPHRRRNRGDTATHVLRHQGGSMTAGEIDHWTAAIDRDGEK